MLCAEVIIGEYEFIFVFRDGVTGGVRTSPSCSVLPEPASRGFFSGVLDTEEASVGVSKSSEPPEPVKARSLDFFHSKTFFGNSCD